MSEKPTDEQVYEWIESHYGDLMTKHLLDEHKRLLIGQQERGPLHPDPNRGFLPADLDKILQTVRHARACIAAGHEPIPRPEVER